MSAQIGASAVSFGRDLPRGSGCPQASLPAELHRIFIFKPWFPLFSGLTFCVAHIAIWPLILADYRRWAGLA